MENKKDEFESSLTEEDILDVENQALQDRISLLENQAATLRVDLDLAKAEADELQFSLCLVKDNFLSTSKDLQLQGVRVKDLQEENAVLRGELGAHMNKKQEYLNASSLRMVKCIDSVENVNAAGGKICCSFSSQATLLGNMFQEICVEFERMSRFLEEFEHLENLAKELASETDTLQAELSRKDDILNGLVFNMSTLHESSSICMDQKDEIGPLLASLGALENELKLKSVNLYETVAKVQELEAQLQEKLGIISALEIDVAKEHGTVMSLSSLNRELVANMEDGLKARKSMEEELIERRKVSENLETDITKTGTALGEMNCKVEALQNNLNDVTAERDDLHEKMLAMKRELEIAQTIAEENGVLAAEAQEMAEIKKLHIEDKEEEVKLLEHSVEELECIVNVLENKVEILKGEAERQRLEREELEMELQAIRQQMECVKNCDANMRRKLDDTEKILEETLLRVQVLEKEIAGSDAEVEILKGEAERQRLEREEVEMELQAIRQQMQSVENSDANMRRKLDDTEKTLEETLQRVQVLEKEIAARDAEITGCKVHISELTSHAEAQASEYKQKFKVLEAMLEQVKQDVPANDGMNLSANANKLEKNAFKSRGPGSPFKCIGMGLVQQIKSEKEEELSAGRHRIEELEALAASRQKEIFMLNARLATAESMTHDVIHDLMGLKLDMDSCATLMDNKHVQMLMEKAQLHNVQEEEVVKFKQQLNEFIKERKGGIEEIDGKQAEMVTAQVALEKLCQRDQLLATENEMLKVENTNYKKRATELEAEVKNLSGQQNLQQCIHHHAKIKEDSDILKCENDELSVKLRKTEALLELAQYRIADGKSPCINFDEEQSLNNKLKGTGDRDSN